MILAMQPSLGLGLDIDLIDYVTGIGNGSRAPLYRNS